MASQCPLCRLGYQQLSQHLRVLHKVANVEERRLLLALTSRRVDVRRHPCPVAGCRKVSSRLDRHLKIHTELTNAARKKVMDRAKKQKVLAELAELRASKPSVPMVSKIDLESTAGADLTASAEESETSCKNTVELTDEDRKEAMQQKVVAEPRPSEVAIASDLDLQSSAGSVPQAEEGEKPCENARCKAVQKQVEDLTKQVDTLSTTLQQVTQCYRQLQWWMTLGLSAQVTRVTTRLLKALNSPRARRAVCRIIQGLHILQQRKNKRRFSK